MITERLGSSDADVTRASALLAQGKLVAIPTETVYGLAADALDDDAVRSIFAAKGRPADNPLIAHVLDLEQARPLFAPALDARAIALARAFWPGPLTLVSWRSVAVPDIVCASLPKVAVRAPDHAVARAILAQLGRPLAAPSANASGRPSPTSASDVLATLDGRIDAVVDGGPCRVGIESTVVDVTGEKVRVLRPGAITSAQLRAHCELDDSPVGAHEASPGLRHRHYAPAIAHVRVASTWSSSDALLARSSDAVGARTGPTEILPDDPALYARALYAALYRLERARPERLVIAPVPNDDAWLAVRDRVARATE